MTILTWAANYDVKPDGVTMLEASGKKYLEDMLACVRHALENRKNSSGSVSSTASTSGSNRNLIPLVTSTPGRGRTRSIDEDTM